nr:4-hydroxy-3-methylbut-2-enyl diphosphate reductase [Campylobacter sp.]
MKIEIAKNCGFCFGVKRAVKIAQKSIGAASIGELIHNNLEINRLRDKFGVKTIKSIDDLKDEK